MHRCLGSPPPPRGVPSPKYLCLTLTAGWHRTTTSSSSTNVKWLLLLEVGALLLHLLCALRLCCAVNYASVCPACERPTTEPGPGERERERVPFMIGLEKRRKRRGGNVSVPPWPSPVYAFTPAERLFVTESRRFTAWWR